MVAHVQCRSGELRVEREAGPGHIEGLTGRVTDFGLCPKTKGKHLWFSEELGR